MTPYENPLNCPDCPRDIPPKRHNRLMRRVSGPIRAFE